MAYLVADAVAAILLLTFVVVLVKSSVSVTRAVVSAVTVVVAAPLRAVVLVYIWEQTSVPLPSMDSMRL